MKWDSNSKDPDFSLPTPPSPIRLVCFEGNRWAYFDSLHYQIALNKRLMYMINWEVVLNILRPRNWPTSSPFLRWGDGVSAHGKEFRDVCRSYKWTEAVWAATFNLESTNEQTPKEGGEEKVIAKVKKLLALGQSDNAHEAEIATLKANQLLIQHNLSTLEEETGFDEFYVREIFQIKRASSKYQAIQEILQFFYVCPIFNYQKGRVSLEVTGSKANVLIAEYVAKYLDEELERLYFKSGLKGIRQKKIIHERSGRRVSEQAPTAPRPA